MEFIEKIKLINIFNSFRDGLLSKIDSSPGKIIMHVVPLESLDPMKRITSDPMNLLLGLLHPMGSTGYNPRYNADGWRSESHNGYLQLFRNGVIESVKTFSVYENKGEISGPDLETGLVTGLGKYLEAEKTLGINPPLLVMVSMIDVKGYVIYQNPSLGYGSGREIGSDKVVPAPIEVTNYDMDVGQVLRPVLDTIWQAAGGVGSPFYDMNGNRTI